MHVLLLCVYVCVCRMLVQSSLLFCHWSLFFFISILFIWLPNRNWLFPLYMYSVCLSYLCSRLPVDRPNTERMIHKTSHSIWKLSDFHYNKKIRSEPCNHWLWQTKERKKRNALQNTQRNKMLSNNKKGRRTCIKYFTFSHVNLKY